MLGDRELNRETSIERLICRLETTYPRTPKPLYGTGFLVNIPHLPRLCIFTAAHNIRHEGDGTASSIRVRFPRIDHRDNGTTLEWTATGLGKDYFLPDEWDDQKPGGVSDTNWLYDWGIILGPDKSGDLWKEMVAFGFTIDPRVSRGTVHVHGFPENSDILEGGDLAARLDNKQRVFYDISTRPGMSGGPVWMNLSHGASHLHTVVGIHNYDKKGTRLTFDILRRIFSWIKPHLATDQATRLGAVLEADSILRLRKVSHAGAATAFLTEPGTQFDIIPVHVGTWDGVDRQNEYEYVIYPSLPSSPSLSNPAPPSPPPTVFLHMGGEHAEPDTPRSVRFSGVLEKDSMFHVDRKGKTSRFLIVSRDKSWTLSIAKPKNFDEFKDWPCGDITPIVDTARFIKKGRAADVSYVFKAA